MGNGRCSCLAVTEISGVAVFGQPGAPNRRRPRADKAEIYEPLSVYPIPCTAAGLSCGAFDRSRRADVTDKDSRRYEASTPASSGCGEACSD
jgi:hypothetical protein